MRKLLEFDLKIFGIRFLFPMCLVAMYLRCGLMQTQTELQGCGVANDMECYVIFLLIGRVAIEDLSCLIFIEAFDVQTTLMIDASCMIDQK